MSGIAALLSRVELPLSEAPGKPSTGLFFLLAAIGGAITFFWGRFTARRAATTHATLRVIFGERETLLDAMVDTANLLSDPVSGRAVVLLSKKLTPRVLPPELATCAEGESSAVLAALPPDAARRVRLLGAATATGEGLMLGVAPDAAFLDMGKGEHPVLILLAPVALHLGFEACEALLPAEFAEER